LARDERYGAGEVLRIDVAADQRSNSLQARRRQADVLGFGRRRAGRGERTGSHDERGKANEQALHRVTPRVIHPLVTDQAGESSMPFGSVVRYRRSGAKPLRAAHSSIVEMQRASNSG